MANEILKLQNGSDVRGVALPGVEGENVNLTPEICNRIGQAFAEWLSKKLDKPRENLRVGIGMDSRLSGQELSVGVSGGLKSEGVEIFCCGLATTPAMFMSIVFEQTKFDGAIMITASHLPFNRNGLKFFDKDGGLEHDDITEILKIACERNEKIIDISSQKNLDLLFLYSQHLRGAIMCGRSL